MTSVKHICFDRIVPSDLRKAIPFVLSAVGRTRAISPIGKLWVNGSKLRIRFLNGTTAQQADVRRFATRWCEHANLSFEFGTAPDAEIRVTFDEADGAWSYIGTDARRIPISEPTLNLGWVDETVILHEFGHAIGLAHEHQNPEKGILWNEPVVIRDLGGPPNFWDEETVRHNVLEKYSHDQINGTIFDPLSIMLYSFPAEWTLDGFRTNENASLSDLDKGFVAGSKMYPGIGTLPTFTELPVLSLEAYAASIGKAGEEDRYKFTIKNSGRYTIETLGPTDLVMKLFGPNSQTQLVAEDDDSGESFNPRIMANLSPGEYYAQIRHFNKTGGTGSYGIRIIKS